LGVVNFQVAVTFFLLMAHGRNEVIYTSKHIFFDIKLLNES